LKRAQYTGKLCGINRFLLKLICLPATSFIFILKVFLAHKKEVIFIINLNPMKKDYLIIKHFRLIQIIADENIGNTLCGYIPCGDGEYSYVNLFTESFEQLYFLLQSSKNITEPVLIEMAERMSSGEERPILIEAPNLTQSEFIEINLTFCLRNYETTEEWEKSNVKCYFIDKFFEFPDIKFLFEAWS